MIIFLSKIYYASMRQLPSNILEKSIHRTHRTVVTIEN